MSKKDRISQNIKDIINAGQTILITLKIINFITWSWVWVLCPIWIPVALIVLFSILSTLLEKEPS